MVIDAATLKRKPYLGTLIDDCGEKLTPIPESEFTLLKPHPYETLGAPYENASPWMLREGVLKALLEVQKELRKRHSSWGIAVFDAYRPVAVQRFMFIREYEIYAKDAGLTPIGLEEAQHNTGKHGEAYAKALRIFAIPSDNPEMPPPHSTGAAIDITILDETGREIHMGSPIDENSDRSNPDYFLSLDPAAHANRTLLNDLMAAQGFWRNPTEWWHFSKGDQSAVWLEQQKNPQSPMRVARYGRADLVK